jgi:hypothetical protein
MGRGVKIFCCILVILVGGICWFVKCEFERTDKQITRVNEQIMENIGGDLNIVSMDTYNGFSSSGQISGFFTFIEGTYEGKNETIVRFSWQSRDGFFYLYEVPASLFQRVRPKNNDNRLMVNFNLDLGRNDLTRYLDPLRYNQLIKSCSEMVTITMTDEQYAQFLKITYSKP